MASTDEKSGTAPTESPAGTGTGGKAGDERAARLAAALRDNLARRKAQTRGRKTAQSGDGGAQAAPERRDT